MDFVYQTTASALASGILFSTLTFFITKKTLLQNARMVAELESFKKEASFRKEAIFDHIGEDGYKAILDNQYLKGKTDGAKEEIGKFTIHYTPFIVEKDDFFKHQADVGIEMQIFYQGLPIADPMRRITNHEEKFKEENVNYVIDKINETIGSIAEIAASQQIPVRITREPKREGKTKK